MRVWQEDNSPLPVWTLSNHETGSRQHVEYWANSRETIAGQQYVEIGGDSVWQLRSEDHRRVNEVSPYIYDGVRHTP